MVVKLAAVGVAVEALTWYWLPRLVAFNVVVLSCLKASVAVPALAVADTPTPSEPVVVRVRSEP